MLKTDPFWRADGWVKRRHFGCRRPVPKIMFLPYFSKSRQSGPKNRRSRKDLRQSSPAEPLQQQRKQRGSEPPQQEQKQPDTAAGLLG